MATKKVPPKVPPRPAPHILAKSRSASPTVPNTKPTTTRQLIYKSPSLENAQTKHHPPIAEKPKPKPRHKSPARLTPIPLQTVSTDIQIEDAQTIAFTNKFLNEMAEMSKIKSTLPMRPDPEGKEKDLRLEDEPNKLNKVFSEKLISELTALHPSENTEEVKVQNDNLSHQYKKGRDASRESISSADISPNGTRSRIRTSDWIELDNGKQVLMTSCHISLEDSGLEDEEKLDDASSGVGDSWDSVHDTEER